MATVYISGAKTDAIRYAQLTSMKAAAALLFEVAATPKPGLVDRHNTGAHTDMDIALFQKSALASIPYFYQFVRYGTENSDKAPEDAGLIRIQTGEAGVSADLNSPGPGIH